MKVGRAIRTRLGRYEAPISDFYRSRFIDLTACVEIVAEHVEPRSILEIGCGDGQLAQRLLERFPTATYTGIDIAPEVGHLFDGDRRRATFRSIDSRSFLAESPDPFGLVLLVDVLHHVPAEERDDVLRDFRALTAPGGTYVVKDWVKSRSLAHAAVWASDRLLTGDRVSYFEPGELDGLMPARNPDDRRVIATTVPPHANNVLLAYTAAA